LSTVWYKFLLSLQGGSSPLTTNGDLYGFDTGGARIPVGADGTVLTADSTQTLGVKWGAAGGAGSGITRSINSVAVNTVAGATVLTDYVYLVSGTHSVTIPTAVGNSNQYTVKNVGTGVASVNFTGGQNADGSATLSLPVQYQSVDLVSDGANWNII
jgi:hypothetical protein